MCGRDDPLEGLDDLVEIRPAVGRVRHRRQVGPAGDVAAVADLVEVNLQLDPEPRQRRRHLFQVILKTVSPVDDEDGLSNRISLKSARSKPAAGPSSSLTQRS